MSKRIFSGAQPTGNLHIGNYLGALRNWAALQHEYDSIYCVVNLHAVTIPQDPQKLAAKTREVARLYLAAGIDPKVSTLFVQSDVQEHTELAWVLNCVVRTSELERMTQFKDKAKKQRENVLAGLLTYPALMAADILLYQTDLVPIGQDQKQHLELTRDIAERFNRDFGETFRVPDGFIPKIGAKILALDDPSKKMSKSDENAASSIFLTDDEEAVRRKFKRAVTDSGTDIRFDETRPAITNLLSIFHLLTGMTPEETEAHFAGKGYAQLKSDLADATVAFLRPFQERASSISDEELNRVLRDGADRARSIAQETMREVKSRMGLIGYGGTDELTESENVIPYLREEDLDKFRDDARVWVILNKADRGNYLSFPKSKDENTNVLWAFLSRQDAERIAYAMTILLPEKMELEIVDDPLQEIREGAKEYHKEVCVLPPGAVMGFFHRQKESIRRLYELHNPAW